MNIHEKRIKDLQRLIKENGLDGMVVDRALEVGLLTGFALEGAFLLVTPEEAFAYLPKMLIDDFRERVPFVKSFDTNALLTSVVNKKDELGLKKAAFEPETVGYIRGSYWKEKGFIEKGGLTGRLRLVKEGQEIDTLRKSCHIAARAFTQVRPYIKTGCTEMEIGLRLEHAMQAMGAKGPSFDTIVAFGPNAALPHHVTSADRKLRDDECVLMDFGCVYHGYCSDITRTVFNGTPSAEYVKAYDTVKLAHDKGIEKLRPGMTGKEADAVCRDIIADAGYGQYYIHSTGHGVGLEIHEAPALSVHSEGEKLLEGMTATIEPGVYFNGKFGIRIEDSTILTKEGCEVLTVDKDI